MPASPSAARASSTASPRRRASEREPPRERDVDLRGDVPEPRVDGLHVLVAVLRPRDQAADAVRRRPPDLAFLQGRGDAAPAPVAADDREAVLGPARIVRP